LNAETRFGEIADGGIQNLLAAHGRVQAHAGSDSFFSQGEIV
jgi:hypothetical protein